MSDENLNKKPRKKKIEPIEGLGSSIENAVVQKSSPLLDLWKSELTLAEFKLLDVYLSRINSHDPEHREVILRHGEVEKALGVKQIKSEDLIARISNLGQGIKIHDATVKKGFRIVWLFEQAECSLDDNGQWVVKLECTQKAMKYFFNIEELKYVRYKLRSVISFTSRYSYILFTLMEKHRKIGTFTVPVDKLKELLNCTNEETYREFKRFNDLILKKSQKEIHKKTECRFDYETIKRGRKVEKIKFTIHPLPKTILPAPEIELDDEQLDLWGDDSVSLIAQACKLNVQDDCEFTRPQMEHIVSLINNIPDYKLPSSAVIPDITDKRDQKYYRQYHYLNAKYRAMLARDAEEKINNRYKYICAMLEKDALSE